MLLFAALFAIYNSNGREIGTVDSQPAKLTAREIAVNRTLILDRAIAERPALAERPAFARDRRGQFRSAYPIAPALIAAVPATLLHRTGLVDMDAPLAPNLIAAVTASALTAAGVTLVFVTVSRIVPVRIALLTAIGLGLGTNYWALASQTLWQHETVAAGLALALWAWFRPGARLGHWHMWIGGVGLALAGAARPQTAPLVAAFLAWIAHNVGVRRALLPAVIVGGVAALNVAANSFWFGHPLGAAPILESVHADVHRVAGPLSATPWIGALGLLVSPSRGLLVFSPIVLVVLFGVVRAWRDFKTGWLLIGVVAEFVAFASYSVWWAGHTFGPRYMIDLLVPLAVPAALGASWLAGSVIASGIAVVLLIWSMAVAGAGAFVYPNEAWNTNPESVDRHHERLWQVHDAQLFRVFQSRPSPQNFDLFDRAAIRRPAS